jgi:hypothetical protein
MVIDPKDKRKWFEISEDELNARMEAKKALQIEPGQKAVEMLNAALDKVLTQLGVNIELGDIPAQQDQLGIVIAEHTDERAPQLNGFFIYTSRTGDLVPYAWVGSARVDSNGDVLVDIQWFQKGKMTTLGGLRLKHLN